MSRTKRGCKPLGYDYWSKRPYSGQGYGRHIKDMCNGVERMQKRVIIHKETSQAWSEHPDDYYYDLSNDPFYKKLFQNADKIEHYEDICGDLVLQVDGEYFGYLKQWEELRSFQYFTGCNFVDHEDITQQYSDYLENNKSYDWLP